MQVVCERYNIPYKQLQMIPLYESWIAGLGKADLEIFQNKDNPDYKWRYTYPGDKQKDREIVKTQIMYLAGILNLENLEVN